ncbi:hypothetical protein HMH01_07530 [Halovulum dunhuangense]|uniref:Uncharacterized protein n=1 Tax=Halovulum dunhuangense TaxID=1505036 RepID=A0A849L206_9RHOB|nr:hypothetical protein [Halovulum dunhuangense]NNU80289.1 hypothetical protein [Halovulum dunhuangense]
MSRRPVALLVLAGLIAVIALDLGASEPLNPYQAPPLLALGSGLAAGGAHCSAPPSN